MAALLVAARAFHYAALAQLEGGLIFAFLVARPAPEALLRRWRTIAWASLATALVSGALWFAATASMMSGESLSELLGSDALATVLHETRFGRNFALRFVAALLIALGLLPSRTSPALRWALLALSAGMLAGLAWVGHAGAGAGGEGAVRLAGDAIHLMAAGAWLGSLWPFVLMLRRALADPDRWSGLARRVALRFSAMGLASVGLLVVTGLVNAATLVGTLSALVGTLYGGLLMAKIALFLAMIAVAARNRLGHVPALATAEARRRALFRLARNCLVEIALGAAIVFIVAILGTLAPAQPGDATIDAAPAKAINTAQSGQDIP